IKNKRKILTGTPRMCERPIGILVDALRTIGAEIDYLENEGFPPLRTRGFKKQTANKISIRGDVSSQYISALLMVAPVLPDGLYLNLKGTIGSQTYIQMTLDLMKEFGVRYHWEENHIHV